MATISNKEEFERWLRYKSADWAQVLAVRAALRVLPYVARSYRPGHPTDWQVRLTLSTLLANGISWAARNIPAQDMRADSARQAAVRMSIKPVGGMPMKVRRRLKPVAAGV